MNTTNVWDPTFSDHKIDMIARLRLPLLLASRLAVPDQELKPLSHFRMQKGIHLLQQEGPVEWSVFTFRPHVWGQFSIELENTLRFLVEEGLMESDPKPLFAGYRNTPTGDVLVEKYLQNLTEDERELVRGVRLVASMAFARV